MVLLTALRNANYIFGTSSTLSKFSLTLPGEPKTKTAVSRWALTQPCWCLLGVYLGQRSGDYIYMLHFLSKRYHAAAEESDNASNPTPHLADKELLCAVDHPNPGEKTRLAQNYLLITYFFIPCWFKDFRFVGYPSIPLIMILISCPTHLLS